MYISTIILFSEFSYSASVEHEDYENFNLEFKSQRGTELSCDIEFSACEPLEERQIGNILLDDDPLILDDVTQASFLDTGCGCNNNCVSKFQKDVILSSRLDCIELNSRCNEGVNHHHLVLKGALNALLRTSENTLHSKNRNLQRKEYTVKYFFRGVSVCKIFFQYVYATGLKRLKNVKKNFLDSGVAPKVHGSRKRPYNCINLQTRSDAITFIRQFANENGLVLPGRLPGHQFKSDLIILPCSMSKAYVYNKYLETIALLDKTPISRSSWYDLWEDFCPYVVIQKPKTDLCATCQKNVTTLGRMGGLDEKEKIQLVEKSRQHLDLVQNERKYYNNVIKVATDSITDSTLILGPHEPCSYDGVMHYSFDFAQQVHLPHSSQQIGPLYFLTGFKVSLFGVAAEPLRKFVLYVIPEPCATGKGANVIISMLHHFFENFGIGEKDVVCHADNCAGQNKNNYVMQYATWRVLTGRHRSFRISFLPVGHTKFAPDMYFGLFKKSFRKWECNNLKDILAAAVQACPKTKSIVAVLTGDEKGETFVKTYDWANFFQPDCVTINQLLHFSHFETNEDNRGHMLCYKKYTDSQPTVSKVLNPNKVYGFPLEKSPAGMTYERKSYLYNKIREFVREESKDILCPKPIPNVDVDHNSVPTTSVEYSFQKPSIEKSIRQKPTCSYCKQVGHRNQVRGGIYFCPKRKLESQIE